MIFSHHNKSAALEHVLCMQFATQAAARVHEGTIGGRAAEIAEMHPPSISLSLTLDEVILDGMSLHSRHFQQMTHWFWISYIFFS